MASYLVVIYGTSAAGKAAAWHLARALPGKSAVLSVESLIENAIAQPGDDAPAELDMLHTQLRLLVANYMRNGYHVVVEGAFYHERQGQTYRYEQDIDQLVALMRNMTRKALTVHVRGADNGNGPAYRPRYGANAMSLDVTEPEEAAAAIHEKLTAGELI